MYIKHSTGEEELVFYLLRGQLEFYRLLCEWGGRG